MYTRAEDGGRLRLVSGRNNVAHIIIIIITTLRSTCIYDVLLQYRLVCMYIKYGSGIIIELSPSRV